MLKLVYGGVIMIDNFYLHQMMKKSDRKKYLGNKRGIFTITFPKLIKRNLRLKYVFKPGNTYIIKGQVLENMDLVFPNSNVIVEKITFNDCSIEAANGTVTYYCDEKDNNIAKTRAKNVSISNYSCNNFKKFSVVSDNLELNNVTLSNISNGFIIDVVLSANNSIRIHNSSISFKILSNIKLNHNQQLKIRSDKLLIDNSTLSTIIGNKSIKDNDNLDRNDESHFNISVLSNEIELQNSTIESGWNISVYGENINLKNSLIASIANSIISAENLTMDGESDIVAVNPFFWEQYVSNYNIMPSPEVISYNCDKSLRQHYEYINSFSKKQPQKKNHR